jgi:hypothetical protein
MKTLLTIIGLAFAGNTFASCYGLTGYDLVNCLNDERERQFYQNKFEQAVKPKPYEGYIDNKQTCTKQIVNTGAGYYVQTICK